MFKILTAEPTHKILQESLEKAGFICEYLPKLSFPELKSIIPEYDGLVIRSKFKIDRDFIDTAKKLKFIARAGAGMENIDTGYAESKNIKCLNSPEGNRDSVGEHALGMLLTLFHKINIADKEIRGGIWNRQNIGTEIQGKITGIIGYGNMGSAFAQKLKGFSVNVIAYDKYKTGFSDDFVKEVSLKTLFSETDIFSIHIPLTDETHFLINDDFFKKFQKPIYIINTARGKVLKTDDLVKNMKSGKILGACLDVSEYEKTSFTDIFAGKNSPSLQYLVNSDKVIMTPHIAGSSKESYKKIAEILAEKIIKSLK